MWQLGAALAALTLGSLLVRDRCVIAVSAALLANWCACTAIVWLTGNPHPWEVFSAVDYMTGFFVIAGVRMLADHWSLPALLITMSYALLCVVHVSFGLSDQGPWPQYRYWWATFDIAVGQMLFVGVWGICELARNHLGAHRRVAPAQPVPVRSASASVEDAEQ